MKKITMRALAGGVAAALAVTLAGPAFAAVSDPYADVVERDPVKKQYSTDDTAKLYRVAGLDRIQTAIELMNATTKNWGDTVIIARSDDFADALTAGPLADLLDAPVLTTPSTKAGASAIDSRVVAAIKAKGFKHVIVIGGTGVIPDSWRDSLEDATGADVSRISGVDRYDTAIGIAKWVARWMQDNQTDENVRNWTNVNVYLATGKNFPDAMVAGVGASANQGIVLLTDDRQMEERTLEFVRNQRNFFPTWVNHIEIRTVGQQAEDAANAADVRVDETASGVDRYDTAVQVAAAQPASPKLLTVASGTNYPDAVVSGAWAANHDGAMVLVENNAVPAVTSSYIRQNFADTYKPVVVVGGDNSVSRAVSAAIKDLLLV